MRYLWYERGAFASKAAKKYLEQEFNPSKVTKIAVIRHAALGDQVITRPFLVEARRFFPNACITLVGVSNYQYASPEDLADKTIYLTGRHRKHAQTLSDRIKEFRQLEDQDIIFDVAGTNRSYWFTLLNRAKLKFGFPYKPYLCRTLYNIAVFRSDFQAELESMLDMLKMLGHNPQRPLDFDFPDHSKVGGKDSKKIVYFNGASNRSKILHPEQLKELISTACEELPAYQHVFQEGQNNYEKGDSLIELSSTTNFSIQPVMPLENLVQYIARARLVVAPDTGVRNVAISTRTPTVGVFYSTVPFRYTPLEGNHRIVMNSNGNVPNNDQILHEIIQSLKAPL
ncbi:glycosyltransferase family 9 protein [Vibrio profundum]|uniref:glycosyltransferase family 9 protein n=1 Tax=Vibrio profundum TaxID=2910247 RepID=UPI003D0CDF00